MKLFFVIAALTGHLAVWAQNSNLYAGPVKISFWGFICNKSTNDGFWGSDGAGDEVNVNFRSWGYLFNNLMPAQYSNSDIVYGEYFLPYDNRVKAGTVTINGGLKSGDTYIRETVHYDHIPNTISKYAIASGWCDENSMIAILPVIWEVDKVVFPISDIEEFEKRITNAFSDQAFQQKIVSLKDRCDAYSDSNPYSYNFSGTATGLDNYLTGVFVHYKRLRMSLPIGLSANGQFQSNLLVFTPKMLMLLSQKDFGYGKGIIPVTYRDGDSWAASYTILLKIVADIKLKEPSQPVNPVKQPRLIEITNPPVIIPMPVYSINNEFLQGVWKGTWGAGESNKDQFYSFQFNNNAFWVLNQQGVAIAAGSYKIENNNFKAVYMDNSTGWKYEVSSTEYNIQTKELHGTLIITGTGYFKTGKWVAKKTSN